MAEAPKADKGGALRIDPKLVRELAKLLRDNELTEIEVEDGDRKIKVAREPAPNFGPAPAAAAPAPARRFGSSRTVERKARSAPRCL